MQLTLQEVLLLTIVTVAFVAGVWLVNRSNRHTENEKLYWYIIIFIFNFLGVAAYFFEYYFLKKNKA